MKGNESYYEMWFVEDLVINLITSTTREASYDTLLRSISIQSPQNAPNTHNSNHPSHYSPPHTANYYPNYQNTTHY